jgi:hypothetical protein
MHERRPNRDAERLPIYVAESREPDERELRNAWADAAQFIAETERYIGAGLARDSLNGEESRGRDERTPGFLYVGERASLAFIAAVAAGIIEHGQAFVAWARQTDGSPDTLSRFKDAFLGSWESAEDFAGQMLAYLHRADETELHTTGESRPDLADKAEQLAQELQQRGDISVIANPEGGVWIFRGS